MKYRSIAISGPVAAGSTTAAKDLAQKLKLEYRAAGDFFRQYALKHNIPLAAKEQIPDGVERKIDKELTYLAASKRGTVIEGLYIGYFTHHMSHVLKVLLTANEKTRIDRAITRTHTHKETAEDVRKRDKAHDLKFRKLYSDENFLDPKFFDLTIDTTHTQSEEVVRQIIKKFKGN